MNALPRSSRQVATALVAGLVPLLALWRGGVDVEAFACSVALGAGALWAAAGPSTSARSARLRSGRAGGEAGPGSEAELPVLVPVLGAATLLVALQLVPLPLGLVKLLSPQTAAIQAEAHALLGTTPGWIPLSLDRGATGLALALAAIVTAVAGAAALLASRPGRRDRLLGAIAWAGVAVAVVYYGAALLGLAPLLAPAVTFVNTNHLAGFLLVASFTALGFGLRARGAARVGWLAAFAFVGAGVFLSLSRAGIAAFFVGAGVLAALRLRAERLEDGERDRPARRGRLAAAGALVGGLTAAVAVAAWLAAEPIIAELRTVTEESSTAAKLALWPAAAELARTFPLTGIGRGAFATVYPALKVEPYPVTFTHVENTWLQLPVDLGLPAGLALLGAFAWAWLAAARRRDLSRPLAGALAGVAALAAQNLFDFSLELPGVAVPVALALGVAARDLPRRRVAPRLVHAGAAALLLLGAAGLWVHGARPTGVGGAAPRVAEAPTADAALAEAARLLPWQPADWLPPAAVGAKLAGEGRCREALPWLTRAMTRNPTAPEPHRALAGCLARAGQAAFAKRAYRLAFAYGDRGALAEALAHFPEPGALLEVAPDSPDGLLAAANLLRARPAEARDVWARAWESYRDPRALGELAAVTLALGDAEAALGLARELQAAAPAQPSGYVVAARALDALGRGDEAQADLELGAARLPGQASILVPLGYRHLAQRRPAAAKATFEQIVARADGEVARKQLHVARALEALGRYGEALRVAQSARDAAPDDVGALELFSRLAAEVGRYDEAIDALELAGRKPEAKPGGYDARLEQLRRRREEQRSRALEQGLRSPR